MVNNPFRRPQSSYEGPVPLVLVDPDVDKDVTVCFNSAWLPYVTGALSQLVLPTTWDTDDDTERLEQIQRATLLIAMFTTPCGGELEMLDVRQSEEVPCTLEKSTDGGETWDSWANMQLCPPRIRTDKGKLQFFNGTAWVDIPGGGDERFDGSSEPQWTDPPTGESGSCLAAENIVASYVTMLTQTKAGLDGLATISGIVDIVAGYIGTQTLFPPALLVLNISLAVGALATLGSEAIDDLIDSPDVDTLKCIIKCHASNDGAFTADEFEAIQTDVADLIEGPTELIMTEWLNSYGPVGLTRAAAANGILDGDCSDCDCGPWCVVYDFTIESYGSVWHSEPQDGTGWGAAWVTATGWQNNSTAFAVSMIMPIGAHPSEIEVTATDDAVNLEQHATEAWNSTIIVDHFFAVGTNAFAVDYELTENGKLTIARSAGHSPNLAKVKISGTGTRPSGGVNC